MINRYPHIRILALLLCFLFAAAALYAQESEISLNARLKTGFMGVPKGIKEPGREAYIDFSEKSTVYKNYGSTPPPEWDLKFTYVLKDISMGPMGVNPVPFFTMVSNTGKDAVFYVSDKQFSAVTSSSDFSVPVMSEYEFVSDKKFNIETPPETFVFRSSEGRTVKLVFTEITGEDDKGLLFSAAFRYSEIPAE